MNGSRVAAQRKAIAAWVAAIAACTLSCSRGNQLLGWESADTLPWYGGSPYFGRWANGPPASANFWLRAVWMQNPSNAARYQAAGVNFYTGLWEGPTQNQLDALSAANMPAICDQPGVPRDSDRIIRGWLQPDQPDNAQDRGDGTYGPCMPPADVLALYRDKVANDPTRPIYLELGLGLVQPDWEGRGSCAGHPEDYDQYVGAADMLGSVVYPVHGNLPLESVAVGIDRLRTVTHDRKPILAVLETSAVDGVHRPSPAQVRSQIWMSIVHGAAGIEYYCHRIEPSVLETDCIDNEDMAGELARENQLIDTLAPVLDTPPLRSWIEISTAPTAKIDTLVKRHAGHTYLFAVEMERTATTVTFQLGAAASDEVEVLGEERTIAVIDGAFTDAFSSYGAHVYRLGN